MLGGLRHAVHRPQGPGDQQVTAAGRAYDQSRQQQAEQPQQPILDRMRSDCSEVAEFDQIAPEGVSRGVALIISRCARAPSPSAGPSC
jgi:hypothetical protein